MEHQKEKPNERPVKREPEIEPSRPEKIEIETNEYSREESPEWQNPSQSPYENKD